ncbi:Crp/Fnr family transcriptional regulator [Flaviaesturariibacter terrae]
MYERLLNNVRQRIDLDPDEEAFFCSLLQRRSLRKREHLLQEGDFCRHEYFVDRGCLRAYTIDAKGAEHVLQFAVEDWWIGDMNSFISQSPARLAIDALEDSEVLSLDKASWDTLFERVPKFERYFRILLQRAFITLQERVVSGMSDDAETRYRQFRERYPQLEQRVPQRQIASYLGIKPESLSRIRKQLTKQP